MAIASLFLGILGITNLLAISFGHLSLRRINNDPLLKGRKIACTGIAIGYTFNILLLTMLILFQESVRAAIWNTGNNEAELGSIFDKIPLPIKNPSFETGDFSEWERHPGGRLTVINQAVKNSPKNAQHGEYFVWGAGKSGKEAYGVTPDWIVQRVSLKKYKKPIDNDIVALSLSAWGCGESKANENKDGSYMEVEFFDHETGGNSIGAAEMSNTVSSIGKWEEMHIYTAIPPKTRSAKIRLFTFRPFQFITNAGFDNVHAILMKREKPSAQDIENPSD